ncbi:toll/interleukin-1 receptor domain-containing protein [Caulobacter segnis]
MYNFLVTGAVDPATIWDGAPWQIELGRCAREYTDIELTKKFGDFDAAAVAELTKLPSVFAAEAYLKIPPKFGMIRDITKRQGQVRIEYEILKVDPFLSAEDLENMMFELDIGKWELNRTHWALKDVNLPKELHGRGITLPAWTSSVGKAVDISTHAFDVAFSFPGEVRTLVEAVAGGLEARIGPNSYFYDNNYVSQLARPSLDVLLQDIYRNRAKLVVVFLSSDYQNKNWCGIEFRAIRDIIAERDHKRIMFIRTDDGAVDGVFATDGYVDARKFNPDQLAAFIQERAALV